MLYVPLAVVIATKQLLGVAQHILSLLDKLFRSQYHDFLLVVPVL